MIDIAPQFIKENLPFFMGKSRLEGVAMRPLETGYNTLYICQSGWAIVSLYNKRHLFRKGDLLNANWDMRPVVLATSGDFSTYYCVMAEEFFYDVFRHISGAFCDFTYSTPILRPQQEQAKVLHDWLDHTCWIDRTFSGNPKLLMVKNQMENLFLAIDIELSRLTSENPPPALPRALEIIRQFGMLLQNHAAEHHDVAFYADKLCITPYYLSTITAQVMLDTPKGLIDKQIIQAMKVLLTTSNAPLKEIADKMYFEDTSYMSRFFRRHTGLSPSDFRQKSRF